MYQFLHLDKMHLSERFRKRRMLQPQIERPAMLNSPLPLTPVLPAPAAMEWLNPAADAEWDAFVKRHPLGLIYHLSAWRRMLKEAFPHIDGRFLVLRRSVDGAIQAGLPVYTVNSWLLGRRVSSVPFASFCDPLVSSSEEFDRLLMEVERLRQRGNRRLEIRANKTASLLARGRVGWRSHYKHHYLSLEKESQTLFGTFAKSSIQQKALKAIREGVVIDELDGEKALRLCYSIIRDTRARLSLPALPYSFFQSMGRWLPEYLKIFVARHDRKAVACHIVLRFKGMWISEQSGSTDDAHSGVNQLIYWETIKCAQSAGAHTFSFGRTSITNEGLLSYKRRWSPIEEDLFDFTSPVDPSLDPGDHGREQSTSYRLMRSILAKAPSPLYEAIGAFCYRHLG
jgi:hypothetical protein